MQSTLRTSFVSLLAVLSIALAAPHAYALEDFTIQISPRVGYASLKIDAERTISRASETQDALNLGIGVAVVAPFGGLVELTGLVDHSNTFFSADDNYELSQYSLALGYQLESDDGIRLTPKIGRARWYLDAREGQLFNPGPEEEREFAGYDYYWEIALQKNMGQRLIKSAGLVFRSNSYDFGRGRSISFILTFNI